LGTAPRSVDPWGRRLRTGSPARPPCRDRWLPASAHETARPERSVPARTRCGRLAPARAASRGALLRRGDGRDPARVRDGAGSAGAVRGAADPRRFTPYLRLPYRPALLIERPRHRDAGRALAAPPRFPGRAAGVRGGRRVRGRLRRRALPGDRRPRAPQRRERIRPGSAPGPAGAPPRAAGAARELRP